MKQAEPLKPTASRLAVIPLAVAYLVVPLGAALTRLLGPTPEASPFLPWLVLAALGTIHAILFRRSGARLKKQFFFELTMFLFLIGVVFLRREDILLQMGRLTLMAPELTPLIMLWFCGLWAITFGLPDRTAFQRYGAALGALCVLDLGLEGVVYQAVPALRWIGNSNVLAGLLLASLCAGLRPGRIEGGLFEPDQGASSWRILILAGLLATLSRTGLFAAGWIYLFFGRGSRLVRVSVSLACFLLLGITFLLPTAPTDLARYVDYWLWAKSVNLFMQDPGVLLFGLPLSHALPISFPPEMARLWEAVTGAPVEIGIYLQQVTSFWLRFILGWGLIVPLFSLVGLFLLLFRRMTRMGAGLTAAIFAQGMSTPLLYDPTLATVTGLALFLALAKPTPLPETNVRDSVAPKPDPDPKPAPKPDMDPAVEWDLRPL